ncbi:MAG: (2Fe-2S)-binding protein, partial [Chloroflexi bacterium]|nr:(2Fe-2S)-binding protein [Chloroflexota bacterium]
MDRVLATLQVNGQPFPVAVRPYDVLLDTLREQLNLTGTKRGCDMGTCGCCAVIVDGKPRLSCLTLTLEAEGHAVTTVEGLRHDERLHPVQEAFAGWGGSQCGFCTPGFVMTSVCLLQRHPDPSDTQIKEAIAGNLCRCTGYVKIVEAIRDAGRKLREQQGAAAANGLASSAGDDAPAAASPPPVPTSRP